jgi:hypothetical protein
VSIDFVTSRKDIPFNELVPRLAPFGITEIKERSLLRHAVGVRQARPGAADHLARFRFAAPVAGQSGRSEWPAAPAGRPLASDPGECTGSGFLARRVASHDRGDGP